MYPHFRLFLFLLCATRCITPTIVFADSLQECPRGSDLHCDGVQASGEADSQNPKPIDVRRLEVLACNGDSASAFILWQAYENGGGDIPKDLARAERWRLQERRLLAEKGATRSESVPGIIGNLSPDQLPRVPEDKDLCASVVVTDVGQYKPAPAISYRYGGGREYKRALLGTIEHAEKIVVTEHSFDTDLYDTENQRSLIPSEIVYGTRPLSVKQHRKFQEAIRAMNPDTKELFSSCLPEILHTIRFYLKGELISTFGICFQCGQVEWEGTKAVPPYALLETLYKFIKEIGLEPERDWGLVAREHLKGSPAS